MKIFLMERIGEFGYDEIEGFVVIAKDENEARKIAEDTSYGDEPTHTWIDKTLSTCEEIETNVGSCVILTAFNAG